MLEQAKAGQLKTIAFVYELGNAGAANGYLGLHDTDALLRFSGLLEVTKLLVLDEYMNVTEEHDGPPEPNDTS